MQYAICNMQYIILYIKLIYKYAMYYVRLSVTMSGSARLRIYVY